MMSALSMLCCLHRQPESRTLPGGEVSIDHGSERARVLPGSGGCYSMRDFGPAGKWWISRPMARPLSLLTSERPCGLF
jgi:hypothetical protein